MKVLVTGAAGFVGHHLVRRMLKRGDTVRAMIHSRKLAQWRLGDVMDRMETVEADVNDPGSMAAAVQGVDAVIHLVAINIEKHGATYDRVNRQGTLHTVDAAVKAGVKRFIMMSQNGSNSKSWSPFVRSKGMANDYVQQSPLDWTVIHPSLIFGEGDRVFGPLARAIHLTPLVFPALEFGKPEFQPVYVEDVAEVTLRCLDDPGTIGKHYDLGGPEILNFGEILRRILGALGKRRLLVPVPANAMLLPTYLIHKLLPHPPASIPLLRLLRVPNVVLHNNAFEQFGIKPQPFSGERLAYLRKTSAAEAISNFLGKTPD